MSTTSFQRSVMRTINFRPYLAPRLLRLVRVETRDVPTAGVSTDQLLVNPDFYDSLPPARADFVTLHEILHLTYEHHLRSEGRDPELWNAAGDYRINYDISENFPDLDRPPEGLYNPEYARMTTEEIYTALESQKNRPKNEKGQPTATADEEKSMAETGQCEACPPAQAGLESSLNKADLATGIANSPAGNLPGCIKRFFQKMLEPSPVPWQEILADFFRTAKPEDYSFRRPNRRHLPEYRASQSQIPALDNICIVLDTSGSCLDIIPLLLRECTAIFGATSPTHFTVLLCDTQVSQVYESLDAVPVELSDIGGGTAFRPAFDWVAANMPSPPDCLVYLTDGYGDSPVDPGYPVLWALAPDGKNSTGFGTEVKIA